MQQSSLAMVDQWQNRLTGEKCTLPPEDQPLGLWVASRSKPWAGRGSDSIGIRDDVLPQFVHTEGVVRVYERMQEVGLEAWESWCSFLPIDLQLGEDLVLRKEESLLIDALPHFERICKSPRTHLTVDEIREPVGRARRFPPRAVNVLASHSEDWHSRSFRSVKPKKVLSEVRDDDYAIYENRALFTLRLRLISVMALRLTRLRKLETAIRDFNQGDVTKGRRFRLERLCNLLLEVFDDPPDLQTLITLIHKLSNAQGRLLGLASTLLFNAIKGVAKVSNPLLSTNILRDDDHYRHVSRVWRALETRQKDKLTRQEILTRNCHAMDWFTALLCVRALMLLRLVPIPVSATRFGAGLAPVTLRFGWNLRWCDNGVLLLDKDGRGEMLRVVGVPIQIDKLPESAMDQLRSCIEQQSPEGSKLLLVSLGQEEDVDEEWMIDLRSRHERSSKNSEQFVPIVNFTPVSPTSFDSIENVARIMRSVVAEVDWPKLPLPMEREQRFPALFPDLSHSVQTNWSSPPTSRLLSELSARLLALIETDAAKERELEQLQQAERVQRGSRSTGSRINYTAEKHRVRGELDDIRTRQAVLRTTRDAVEVIARKFEPALVCPCCDHRTENPPEGSAFTCSSDSCKTRWGRIHDDRGNLRPFLYPDGTNPETLIDPRKALGADYL